MMSRRAQCWIQTGQYHCSLLLSCHSAHDVVRYISSYIVITGYDLEAPHPFLYAKLPSLTWTPTAARRQPAPATAPPTTIPPQTQAQPSSTLAPPTSTATPNPPPKQVPRLTASLTNARRARQGPQAIPKNRDTPPARARQMRFGRCPLGRPCC